MKLLFPTMAIRKDSIMNKTLQREAELQRRHVRWFAALQGCSAIRLLKSIRAVFSPDEIDRMKRLGVIK
jgi:hypothetical protein